MEHQDTKGSESPAKSIIKDRQRSPKPITRGILLLFLVLLVVLVSVWYYGFVRQERQKVFTAEEKAEILKSLQADSSAVELPVEEKQELLGGLSPLLPDEMSESEKLEILKDIE